MSGIRQLLCRPSRSFYFSHAFRVLPSHLFYCIRADFGFHSCTFGFEEFQNIRFGAFTFVKQPPANQVFGLVLKFSDPECTEHVFIILEDELNIVSRPPCFGVPEQETMLLYYRPNFWNTMDGVINFQNMALTENVLSRTTHNFVVALSIKDSGLALIQYLYFLQQKRFISSFRVPQQNQCDIALRQQKNMISLPSLDTSKGGCSYQSIAPFLQAVMPRPLPFSSTHSTFVPSFGNRSLQVIHPNQDSCLSKHRKAGRPRFSATNAVQAEQDGRLYCRWGSCDQSFPLGAVDELSRHVSVHINEATENKCLWLGCQQGAVFPSKAGLRRHLRYHTKDKPCRCTFPGCNFTCVDMGELNRHKRVVHKASEQSK